jgi:hypothetical protein
VRVTGSAANGLSAGVPLIQFKSNSITPLTVTTNSATQRQTYGHALFTAKANVQDVTNPSAPASIDGNGTIQVLMDDDGQPGSVTDGHHVPAIAVHRDLQLQRRGRGRVICLFERYHCPRTAELPPDHPGPEQPRDREQRPRCGDGAEVTNALEDIWADARRASEVIAALRCRSSAIPAIVLPLPCSTRSWKRW